MSERAASSHRRTMRVANARRQHAGTCVHTWLSLRKVGTHRMFGTRRVEPQITQMRTFAARTRKKPSNICTMYTTTFIFRSPLNSLACKFVCCSDSCKCNASSCRAIASERRCRKESALQEDNKRQNASGHDPSASAHSPRPCDPHSSHPVHPHHAFSPPLSVRARPPPPLPLFHAVS